MIWDALALFNSILFDGSGVPSGDIVLIIAGCLILLIGLIGGGIKSNYITVGSVSIKARIVCAVTGVLLIGTGVALKLHTYDLAPTSGTSGSSAQPSQSELPNASGVSITILADGRDHLRKTPDLRFTEEMSIELDGKAVADLRIDQDHPNESTVVQVSNQGPHHYYLSFYADYDAGPYPTPLKAKADWLHFVHEGVIEVTPNSKFIVEYEAIGRPALKPYIVAN
jgi:hypothetical protein